MRITFWFGISSDMLAVQNGSARRLPVGPGIGLNPRLDVVLDPRKPAVLRLNAAVEHGLAEHQGAGQADRGGEDAGKVDGDF